MVLPICHSLRLPLCLLALCIASSGCQMFEALSPAQLWKLNRQPDMDSGDAYFSIPAESELPAVEGDVVSKLEAPELH
jgi:hypothetical protein